MEGGVRLISSWTVPTTPGTTSLNIRGRGSRPSFTTEETLDDKREINLSFTTIDIPYLYLRSTLCFYVVLSKENVRHTDGFYFFFFSST